MPITLGNSLHGPETAKLMVLRLLEPVPPLTQRGLSQAVGLGLGKAQDVLQVLLYKSLVKIGNNRRSDRKLAYVYLRTSSGLREKLRLTRNFLMHKEAEFGQLGVAIAGRCAELERNA